MKQAPRTSLMDLGERSDRVSRQPSLPISNEFASLIQEINSSYESTKETESNASNDSKRSKG